MADFCGQDEADVEDLFDRDLFVELVNNAYGLENTQKLTTDKLVAADNTTERNVKKAEAYFRMLPPEVPEFSHYTPAHWLIQNPKFLAKKGKAADITLNRFEEIFRNFNGLI